MAAAFSIAHPGFFVHPLDFVNNVSENIAEIFDHLDSCLTGTFVEVFAHVHGPSCVADSAQKRLALAI